MRAGRGRRGRSGGCQEGVAYRALAAQQRPESRADGGFVERHQDAIANPFGDVLSRSVKHGAANGPDGQPKMGDGMPWTRCRPLTARSGAAVVYKLPATKADRGR